MVQLSLKNYAITIIGAAIGWIIVTALDNAIDNYLLGVLGMDPKTVKPWIIIALIGIVASIVFLYLFKMNLSDVLGVVLPNNGK